MRNVISGGAIGSPGVYTFLASFPAVLASSAPAAFLCFPGGNRRKQDLMSSLIRTFNQKGSIPECFLMQDGETGRGFPADSDEFSRRSATGIHDRIVLVRCW
jgi:hypothetical protein